MGILFSGSKIRLVGFSRAVPAIDLGGHVKALREGFARGNYSLTVGSERMDVVALKEGRNGRYPGTHDFSVVLELPKPVKHWDLNIHQQDALLKATFAAVQAELEKGWDSNLAANVIWSGNLLKRSETAGEQYATQIEIAGRIYRGRRRVPPPETHWYAV